MKVLEEWSNVALDWLAYNEMIANPDKFHAIIVKKDRSDTTGINIKIKGQNILTESTIKLLGVKLDYKLNFDPHISDLCKKAANQLNVLKRLKRFIGFETRKLLVQSFVYSISTIVRLHGIFHLQNLCIRSNEYKNVLYDFNMMCTTVHTKNYYKGLVDVLCMFLAYIASVSKSTRR